MLGRGVDAGMPVCGAAGVAGACAETGVTGVDAALSALDAAAVGYATRARDLGFGTAEAIAALQRASRP